MVRAAVHQAWGRIWITQRLGRARFKAGHPAQAVLGGSIGVPAQTGAHGETRGCLPIALDEVRNRSRDEIRHVVAGERVVELKVTALLECIRHWLGESNRLPAELQEVVALCPGK